MHFGNWVEQTTTTTGTGDLTLSSVTGRKTFNTEYGTSQVFPYLVKDASNVPIETGLGILTTSTNMQRLFVFEYVAGGSFLKSNDGTNRVSLASGTKTVVVAAEASLMCPNPPKSFAAQNATANNRIVIPSNIVLAEANTISLTQGRLYAYPALIDIKGPFDAFAVRASASANVDVGLYRMLDTGLPGALVVGVNNQAVVSGMNYLTFSSTRIQPGWYILATNVSAAISMYRATLTEGYGRTDVSTSVPTLYKTQTQGTLPDPFGTPTVVGNLAQVPNIGLRHV